MKNNDKKPKAEMKAEEMKAVSGGASYANLPVLRPVVVAPLWPGDLRHW